MKLGLDGSTSSDPKHSMFHGYEKGFSDHPPFAVFDEDRQENVFVSRWAWRCRLYIWWKRVRLSGCLHEFK